MIQCLPYGEFKLVKNVDNFDVNYISKNSFYGYILEVDIEYPGELHNLHTIIIYLLQKNLKLLMICQITAKKEC